MSIEKQKMISGEHYRPGDEPTDCGHAISSIAITTLRLMKKQNARPFWRNCWGKVKGLILSRVSAVTMDITFIWAKSFTRTSIA